MLVGVVKRDTDGRAPFPGVLSVNFTRNGKHVAQGAIIHTNSGGIQFHVPLETVLAPPEEEVAFDFNLPFHGLTRLVGKIRQVRLGLDNYQNRICYYDAKFQEMPRDVWNDLVDYIQMPSIDVAAPPPLGELPVQRVSEDRLDYRVNVSDIKVEIKPDKGKLIRGRLEDLSIGGARVFLPQRIEVREKATFRIRRKAFQLFLQVECTRIEPTEGGEGFRAGLRFEDLEKEQIERLREIVFQLVGEEKGQ